MAKLGINTTPPIGTPLPDGGGNINSNFDELYTLLGDGNELVVGVVTQITAGNNIAISSSYGSVSIAVTNTLLDSNDLDAVTDRGNVTTNGIRVGVATATSFVKQGGTSSQFLKADGSVDTNTYLTSSSTINVDLDDVTGVGNSTNNNIIVGGVAALGNVAAGASILAVNSVIGTSFRRIGGSSTEFLKGDGSVDTNTYATESYVDANAGYWVQDSVGINTVSNVGIGTTAGAETLIVGGDARILGVLTVGSASITIDGDSESINVGTGVSITNDAITVGTGITISSVTNQIFIQGEEVIDRWKIGAVGISTTNEVGIGTTAKADYQLDVLGDTRITGNLTFDGVASGIVTQITAGNGISIDPLAGTGNVTITAVGSTSLVGSLQQVTDNGDSTTNTIEALGFIRTGGTNSQFLKADGSVDSNTYATTSFLAAETSARQQGDAELETKIGVSTAGLASETAVGLATAGLASETYVDTKVGLATAGISTDGLASVAYVDQEIANVGTADTAGLASIVYVDNAVAGISTAGLASESFVGLATAGLASIAYVDQEIAGVSGGSTSDVRTNSLVVSGVSTFNSDVSIGGTIGVDDTIYYSKDRTNTIGGGPVHIVPANSQTQWSFRIDTVDNLNFDAYVGSYSEVIWFQPDGGAHFSGKVELTTGTETGEATTKGYVDNLVSISTAGLGGGGGVSQSYVDNLVGVSTALTLSDVATNGNSYAGFLNANGYVVNGGTASQFLKASGGLDSNTYATETAVGLATAGLASIAYVDQEIANVGSADTAGLASIVYVDQQVGLSTVGLASVAYVDSKPTATWTLGAQGTDNYTFDGPGFDGPTADPNIILIRGQKYNFVNNMGQHPFRIQRTPGQAGAVVYDDGITNNSVSNGTLEWDVQFDAPDTLYYQCTAHTNMRGEIYVLNNVGSANTTGLASIAYVDQQIAGVSTETVLTTSLAVKNSTTAALTVGQDVDGSGVDHYGIYYGSDLGATGADLFTSNGDMSFWVDGAGGGGSQFEFGSGFGAAQGGATWVNVSTDGVNVSGIVTATSFVGDGSSLTGISTRPYPGTRYTYNQSIVDISNINNLASGQFWIEEVGGNFSIWVADTDADGVTQFGNISASFSHTYSPKQIFTVRDHYNGQVVRHGQFEAVSVSNQASGKKIEFSCGSSTQNVFLSAGGSLQNNDLYSLDITGWL